MVKRKGLFMLTTLLFSAALSTQVYATTPESIATDNELIQKYAEELQDLKESQEALSESEIKSQEEGNAEDGDASEEVLYGGVKPGTNTGYINVILGPPDYVHETGFLHVIDINSGALYGCKNYEANGFYSQICVPAGIYMIADGGLISDTTSRFYVEPIQFQVKAGSQKDIVVPVYDAQPEREEEAYPETLPETVEEITNEIEETESNLPEEQPEEEISIIPIIIMALISIAGVVGGLFGIWHFVVKNGSSKKNNFTGFDQ